MTKKSSMTKARAEAIKKAAEKNPGSETKKSEFDERAKRAAEINK